MDHRVLILTFDFGKLSTGPPTPLNPDGPNAKVRKISRTFESSPSSEGYFSVISCIGFPTAPFGIWI